MNKKLMTLAVAGAFAAPAAAFAQASNVQIFGTMYMEYAYAKQSLGTAGDLVNVDILQSPGSEIGFKGEEALGGGMSAWFQCASTADIRGTGTGGGGQGFCGRNSAIGVKGSFGNAYVGNWDMPMKKTAGAARILSDTGIWGVGPMLFGNSSSFNASGSAFAFSRRQNNSLFYDTPVFSGFQGFFGISTTTTSIANTNAGSGTKPRMWGAAGTYTNGPLYLNLGYENHSNFSLATLTAPYSGNDTGWQAGAAYQFGPVKAGLLYTSRKWDMGLNAAGIGTDMKVTAWNIAAQWAIQGPHALRGGYTRAQNTSGSNASGLNGNLIANAGAGSTGGSIWQVQYVYNASKRTEMTVGYVALSNDTNARYSLGGLTAPTASQNQSAFAVSIKNTF
jgi:predicted porin